MRWESKLLGSTRLRRYRQCMRLIHAYAELAPLWERLCLVAYCGLGTLLANCFGVDTTRIWTAGEAVVLEMLAASQLSTDEIARQLRAYVRFRQANSCTLASDEAYHTVYKQEFYPLVQHLNFALQPSAAARMEFVLRVAASCENPRATVADLGCGSGAMLCRVLELHAGWQGHGLDISPAAVRYSRRLAGHSKVERQAEFQIANATCLPLASQSVDMVVASEVLEHVPGLESALREIARVLVPGGRAAITVPLASRTPLHVHSLTGEHHILRLSERAGLCVADYKVRRERVGYGDDPGHLFLLAERGTEVSPSQPKQQVQAGIPALARANSWSGAFENR